MPALFFCDGTVSTPLSADDVVPTQQPARWPRPWPDVDPRLVLGLLLFASLLARVIWLTQPSGALIFDEKYYVNAARVILGLKVAKDAPYHGAPTGLDPNQEHPPLGKVLMAGAMRVFGDNAVGWRLVSVIAGIAAILLLYLAIRAAGGDQWLALLGAGLFSADNLALVHSRIGTLDMPLTALLLLASWLVLRGSPLLAGCACALATLVKIVGVYGLAALLLLLVLLAIRDRGPRALWSRPALVSPLLLLAGFVPVWFGGLWLLDLHFSAFHTPWDHLHYMLHYGFNLTDPAGISGIESGPWQWLVNEVQINYLTVNDIVRSHGQVVATHVQVRFLGAMNPFIIGASSLGLAYSLWRAWRVRDTLSLWVVAWMVGMYLPYYPLVLAEHRIAYIYYMLPILPAMTTAVAQLLRQGGLPRFVMWAYILAVVAGFAGCFPFRAIP